MAKINVKLGRRASTTLFVLFSVAILQARTTVGQAVKPAPPTIATVYTAAPGEPLSKHYSVTVGEQDSPTYVAPVQVVPNIVHRGIYQMGEAAFTSFDLQGTTTVSITEKMGNPIQSAKVLPSSRSITPTISGHTISFKVSQPGPLTVDVNGDWLNDISIFVNPPETNVPDPKNSNVIYFGPGIHFVNPTQIGSNKTVYIAGGAVIYGQLDPSQSAFSPNSAIFFLNGKNITLRGRGIIDGSLIAAHLSNLVAPHGSNIHVEGVLLRNSYSWHLPVWASQNVTIDNVKIIGAQMNADGIDIVNSQHVRITNSYVRAFDDLVVVKARLPGGPPSSDISVTGMVLWNGLAGALKVGAQFRADMHDITFSDSDIIHDKGREWLLWIFDTDSGTASNISFNNIRVEECRQLLSVWIGQNNWSTETTRGHINTVTFSDIQTVAPDPNPNKAKPTKSLNFVGYDANHVVHGVILKNVAVAGKPITESDIDRNAFVTSITLQNRVPVR